MQSLIRRRERKSRQCIWPLLPGALSINISITSRRAAMFLAASQSLNTSARFSTPIGGNEMEYSEFQKLVWRYGLRIAERALRWWQRQGAGTKALIPVKNQAQYCIDNQSDWILRF